MNSQLFARALGTTGPEALQRAELSKQLHAIQNAPGIHFDGHDGQIIGDNNRQDDGEGKPTVDARAHQAGVNCIAIDRFEGR